MTKKTVYYIFIDGINLYTKKMNFNHKNSIIQFFNIVKLINNKNRYQVINIYLESKNFFFNDFNVIIRFIWKI